MEPADGQRGRDVGAQRRSPLDVIMNQIRRKRGASDRKSLGRFLSRTGERAGIPEDGEAEVKGAATSADSERLVGLSQVCVFLHKLGKKNDHRRVNVAHCDLTATELLELALLLPFLPLLEDVDLSWNDLIGGGLRALTSHLHHVGGVRTLRLSSCRLSADDVIALGESLDCVPLLEVLDLSWNAGVGGGSLQSLLGKLSPSLRELHLVACQLTAAEAAAVGVLLPSLLRLHLLDVSCNSRLAQDSDAGGFSELAAGLAHAAALGVLRLQGCGLTGHALHALGGSLHGLPSLRELDLSCNKRLSGELRRLTVHLAHLPVLESLDLHLCALRQDDLDALIQVLPALSALTQLDLSSNQTTGGVVGPLLSTLTLAQLRQLPLNNCSLSPESLTALAVAVPFLHSVDVSWSKVVGGRVASLLDALQPSVILELRLCSCDITTDDLYHLASACQRGALASLRVLDLSFNGAAGGAGWAALFSAGGLGSLEDLDLSRRPSGSASCSAWLPALLAALPGMVALARLAARRWSAGVEEQQRLSHTLKKRGVLLEWDPQGPKEGAAASPGPAAS